nr:hypothetical protein [Tanacetum cinerariifolium]
MANLSKDIQCASSDTRPPMIDRTNFASWQQRTRLYCRGKENGVNILKSIDEGPFQMGTLRETLTEETKGALHLGPERSRVYFDLTFEDKDRYNADIRATNILLQGLPKDIYSLINHYTDAKDIWDNVKMLLEGSELTKKTVNHNLKLNRGLRNFNYDQLYTYLKQHENGVTLDEEQLLFIAGGQDNVVDEDVDKEPIQDLELNVDNVFQSDDCDAFDSDDAVFKHHEVHEMHDDVQPNYGVDSYTGYTSDSNMIPYDQYVKENVVMVLVLTQFFEIKKLKASIQGKDNVIRKLRTQISQLQETRNEADRTLDFRALDIQITQLTKKVSVLQEQNELFRVENAKVKQHYKELYDSIKITRAKHIDQTTVLLTKNENLKVQINAKLKCITIDFVTLKVLAHGMYAIDVEPIPPRLRNIREVHLDYLKHLKESVVTLREIVEEAKATTPLNRTKQVTFADWCETSNTNTQKHVEQQITQKTNVPVLPSTGVDSFTDASESKPRSNTKKNKILPSKSVNKNTVEDHSRTNKSHLQKLNRVDSSISSKRTVINSNFDSVCKTCNKCFISANHDMCMIKYLNSVNAPSSAKNVVRIFKQVWKPKHVKKV